MRQSPSGQLIPNELARYSCSLVTALASSTVDLVEGSPGATPIASPTLDPSVFFTLPGGSELTSGALVVISAGDSTGDPIDLQWVISTITNPLPAAIGALHKGVIDPAQPAGLVGSKLDFSDIVVPDGGAVLIPQLIIGALTSTSEHLSITLTVGIVWSPSKIRNPPS